MTLVLTLMVIGLLTYGAWRDRAQLADDWTLFLRELGL